MNRTRRLRRTENIRRLVRENSLQLNDLVYPIFIEEGQGIEKEIPSMPGIKRFSLDTISKELDEVSKLDIPAVLLLVFQVQKMRLALRPGTIRVLFNKVFALLKNIILSYT